MIGGALTLSDTMRHAANSLTSSSYKGTDAVVSARTAFDTTENETATTPTVSAGLLAEVRALPQVGVAVGDLTNYDTKIVDAKGKVLGGGPYFGVGFDSRTPGATHLTPFRLKAGRYATAPEEVVISGAVSANSCALAIRRPRSMPLTMFPHWSEPPICRMQPLRLCSSTKS